MPSNQCASGSASGEVALWQCTNTSDLSEAKDTPIYSRYQSSSGAAITNLLVLQDLGINYLATVTADSYVYLLYIQMPSSAQGLP